MFVDEPPTCRYCGGRVYLEPGFVGDVIEGSYLHEECWQMSGEDNGTIVDIYKDTFNERGYIDYYLGLE